MCHDCFSQYNLIDLSNFVFDLESKSTSPENIVEQSAESVLKAALESLLHVERCARDSIGVNAAICRIIAKSRISAVEDALLQETVV